jgi:hypothetical protein
MNGVHRYPSTVVVLQVPGDGVRAVIKAFAGQFLAQFDDQLDGGLGQPGRAGMGAARARLEGSQSF